MAVDELLEIIEKESVFYDESGGGVALSEGEPLLQHEFLYQVLKALNENGIHTTMDTCGLAKREAFENIIDFTDLFLFDLKHFDQQKHELYTDADNSPILRNLEFPVNKDAKLQLRVPVIEGINDSDQEMKAIIDYLKSFDGKIKDVNLLPFHSIAKNKYQRFQKQNKL